MEYEMEDVEEKTAQPVVAPPSKPKPSGATPAARTQSSAPRAGNGKAAPKNPSGQPAGASAAAKRAAAPSRRLELPREEVMANIDNMMPMSMESSPANLADEIAPPPPTAATTEPPVPDKQRMADRRDHQKSAEKQQEEESMEMSDLVEIKHEPAFPSEQNNRPAAYGASMCIGNDEDDWNAQHPEICTYVCYTSSGRAHRGIIYCKSIADGEQRVRKTYNLLPEEPVTLEACTKLQPFSWPLHNFNLACSKAGYAGVIMAQPRLYTAYFSDSELKNGMPGPTIQQLECDSHPWQSGDGQVFCAIADDHDSAIDLISYAFYMAYGSSCDSREPQEAFVDLLKSRIEAHLPGSSMLTW